MRALGVNNLVPTVLSTVHRHNVCICGSPLQECVCVCVWEGGISGGWRSLGVGGGGSRLVVVAGNSVRGLNWNHHLDRALLL